VRVCLESTGLYGLDAALALHADARVELMVANPRAVKDFARARSQRSKTDPLGARVLLEYAARMPFQRWQPPSAAGLQITALARRIHALTRPSQNPLGTGFFSRLLGISRSSHSRRGGFHRCDVSTGCPFDENRRS
jgi:hypothetical protein